MCMSLMGSGRTDWLGASLFLSPNKKHFIHISIDHCPLRHSTQPDVKTLEICLSSDLFNEVGGKDFQLLTYNAILYNCSIRSVHLVSFYSNRTVVHLIEMASHLSNVSDNRSDLLQSWCFPYLSKPGKGTAESVSGTILFQPLNPSALLAA